MTRMEIRFRRKGEMSLAYAEVPPELVAPGGARGVDLTRYAVFYMRGGRGTRERAAAFAVAQGLIVIYQYEYRSGYGDGVCLPDGFDPSRVEFYRPASQIEEERVAAQDAALVAAITKRFPTLKKVVVEGERVCIVGKGAATHPRKTSFEEVRQAILYAWPGIEEVPF